jgi:hypothetical protein
MKVNTTTKTVTTFESVELTETEAHVVLALIGQVNGIGQCISDSMYRTLSAALGSPRYRVSLEPNRSLTLIKIK